MPFGHQLVTVAGFQAHCFGNRHAPGTDAANALDDPRPERFLPRRAFYGSRDYWLTVEAGTLGSCFPFSRPLVGAELRVFRLAGGNAASSRSRGLPRSSFAKASRISFRRVENASMTSRETPLISKAPSIGLRAGAVS